MLPDIKSNEWTQAVEQLTDAEVIAALAERLQRIRRLQETAERLSVQADGVDTSEGPERNRRLFEAIRLQQEAMWQRTLIRGLRIEMESLILHAVYPSRDGVVSE